MLGEADFSIPCYGGYYLVRVVNASGPIAPDDDVISMAKGIAERHANNRAGANFTIPFSTPGGRQWHIIGEWHSGTPGASGGVVG